MARGGGHHSHHSSHHSHHSHYSHHTHRHYYGRSVYGGGKSAEERRWERKQIILMIGIFFFLMFWTTSGMTLSKAFSLPRHPLSAGSVQETAYYTDPYGYVKSEAMLTDGMRYFFEKTGVQPYVYYTDARTYRTSYSSLSGMDRLYSSLFEDEGHFLLIISGDSVSSSSHNISYYYGADVDQVMDQAAIDLFFENFDDEVRRNTDVDVIISNAFRRTADGLTGIRAYGVGYIVILIFLLAGVVALIIAFIRKCRERETAQIIKNSKDHDQILYDDMPGELHAPERMVGDAVKQAELLAEKEKKDDVVWGPTISWADAMKDMQEQETEAEASQEEPCQEEQAAPYMQVKQPAATENAQTEPASESGAQQEGAYIPTVDWGFSMDKGIDLFADEENDKK